MRPIDYDIRIKKPANQNTRERSGATVNLAQLKYVRGIEDLRQASNTTIRERIRDELRKGIDLNPEYTLEPVETVIVMPNPRIGPKKRRFAPAIYNGKLEIPKSVVQTHRRKRERQGF